MKIYVESHKALLFFLTLYFLGSGAMLAWTCVKYLTDRVDHKYHDQYQVVGTSFIISRCAGALIKYNFAIFLFPICYRLLTWMRASMLEWVFPIDWAMNFHRRVGVWVLILGLTHMAAHCVNIYRISHANVVDVNRAFGFTGKYPNVLHTFARTSPTQADIHGSRTGVTGWIMIGCMIILVACAMEKVRRQNFKLFFSVHHLYMPIVICLVIHDGLFNPIEIIYWMIPVISIFLFERGLTLWRSVPKVNSLEATRVLKGDVLALHIQKPAWFRYSAGHYLWINCPAVSPTEWHPFTLTSSPDEDFLMVDINCIGDWTKKLMALYTSHLSSPVCDVSSYRKGKTADMVGMIELSDSPKEGHHSKKVEVLVTMEGQKLPMLRVDGPYGTASSDVLLFTHAVLVGGGIGVTPFISILKSIRYAVLYTNNCPLHAVHFIWVTRNQENFQWFSQMLAELQQHEDLRGFLRVSIYLTGPRHPINDIRLLGVSLLMNKAKEEFNEDLVTGLEAQTHFGRPDFSKIFLQHNQEWSGNDVGVFFCGPPPLAHTVRVTCRALNRANQASNKKKGANFYFKQEHF